MPEDVKQDLRFWALMLMGFALLIAGVTLFGPEDPGPTVELCSIDGGETFEPCP